jgi:hypothetical protein
MHRMPCAAVLAALAVLSSCGGRDTRPDPSRPATTKPAPPPKTARNTPEETFEAVRNAVLAGDLDTAYFYLSGRIKERYTPEQFRQDFERNRDEWARKLEGASIREVAIEPDIGQCSAVVLWGDHTRSVVVFVEEGGVWRELGAVWNQEPGY